MAKQEKEIKKPEIKEVKSDPFEWVSYDVMQERVAKGDVLKEVKKVESGKLYGFIKGK